MNKKYFLLTIMRNGLYETIIFSTDICRSVESFLVMEMALGHETFILFEKEISEESYNDLNRVKN